MYRITVLISLLVAMVLTPVGAQEDGNRVTEDFLAEFEAFIESELAYYNVPGAAVAIVEGDSVVYAQGFGVRNLETDEPVTTETLFRAGSITKSMTSMLVAQLVAEGALDWDTPVTDIWPAFDVPQVDETILVRDLMGMDTGLVSNDLDAAGWVDWTVDDLFASLASMEVGGPYGEFYAYNNEVYATSAYVALAAAGVDPTLEHYIDLMETRIFGPLGMESTVITDAVADLGDNYAESYGFTLAGGLEEPRQALMAPIGVIAPAGAVWTNVLDMADYAMAQMDPSGFVAEDVLGQTWVPQVAMQDADGGLPLTDMHYGMGWVLQHYQGVPMRFHDGGWEGQRANLSIFPEDEIAIIILTNHALGDLFHLTVSFGLAERLYDLESSAADILHTVYEDIAGQIELAQQQLGSPQVDEAAVADYLGAYEGGWSVELRADGLLWMVRPGWEILLYPIMPKIFITASHEMIGAEVTFAGPDGAGRVWMTLDAGTGHIVFDKLLR